MRNLMLSIAVCTFALAAADTMPFTGTWRIDLNKMQAPKKPSQFEVGNGIYRCLTCDPKIEVKADGQDQQVTGHPGFDTLSVKIVSDKVIETTEKKSGKVTSQSRSAVSADGNHAVVEFKDFPQEFTLDQSPDGLTSKDQTGFSYSAKFDCKDYPVTGTNSLDSVVLKRINDRTREEIVKSKGKVKNTGRMTVSADGKMMTIEWRSSNGSSGKDFAEKK